MTVAKETRHDDNIYVFVIDVRQKFRSKSIYETGKKMGRFIGGYMYVVRKYVHRNRDDSDDNQNDTLSRRQYFSK